VTHELNEIRDKRKQAKLEYAGTIPGDIEATSAGDSADGYVVVKHKEQPEEKDEDKKEAEAEKAEENKKPGEDQRPGPEKNREKSRAQEKKETGSTEKK
jgi:hypothetical protein